jgi:hypothetical protein
LAAGGYAVTPPVSRTGNPLLAAVAGVVALADAILAVLGVTAWWSYRDGALTAEQAAPFAVMGASAAAGAVLALLAMIALVRGRRGAGLARAAVNLTWLRLGAVLIALIVVTLTAGVSAAGAFAMVLAVGDALGGFVVTGVAARRTRDG